MKGSVMDNAHGMGFATVIDANLNRVAEGLRVLEDICRFVFRDAGLQQKIKKNRHRINTLVPVQTVIAKRSSLDDVGFSAIGSLEERRTDPGDLVRANSKRVQEGTRVLEELFKTTDITLSREMKNVRYEAYEYERILLAYCHRPRLEAGLYLILTDPPAGYEKMAEYSVEAGLPALQLRYKGDDQRHHLDLARRLREITKNSKTLYIINDRPDIALMVDADGVHIGQSDLPPADVRRCIGDQMLLGLSTHNLEQVNRSKTEPVDYIGIGPLYATTSKENPDPVTGPEIVLNALKAVSCPVVAIGGLTIERIKALGSGSCRNVALISEVAMAENPLLAMQTIQEIIMEKL